MKVLIITTRYFPHVGGVEEVVHNLARNFSSDNDVSIVSSANSKDFDSTIDKLVKVSSSEIERDGYVNKRIWMNLPGSLLGYFLFPYRFIAGIYSLLKYIQFRKPDLINYHFPDDSSIYVWFISKFTKIPLVTNIHGNDLHVFSKSFFTGYFVRKVLGLSEKIIVNSVYMQEEFATQFPDLEDKIEVVPNGLNLEFIEKIQKKEYFDSPYIFFVGRFVEKKGVDVLIKALDKVRDLEIKAVIEGSGEDFIKIKNLVNKLDLKDIVKFTEGKLSSHDKFAIMKGAIFGVMPSRIEPFGIVALEYLAAGLPVIASKTGGLKDLLIENETTLFFKSENIDDLADKIRRMCKDSKLRNRLRDKGREFVKNYNWNRISDRYIDCFKSIL